MGACGDRRRDRTRVLAFSRWGQCRKDTMNLTLKIKISPLFKKTKKQKEITRRASSFNLATKGPVADDAAGPTRARGMSPSLGAAGGRDSVLTGEDGVPHHLEFS